MGLHARLSPSAAGRWLSCPASVRLSEQVPERPAGPAAQAGTLMHSGFERALLGVGHLTRSEVEALQQLGVSEERARQMVDQGVSAARSLLSRYHLTEFLTEHRVNPGARIKRSDFWGTADLIAACDGQGVLLVADFKTGRLPVEPQENAQMLAYASGCLDLLSFEPSRVVLAVLQPPVWGDQASVWETDLPTLHAFEAYAQTQAASTDLLDVTPNPSEAACQWCRGRAVCPAFTHPDWA